MHPSSNPSNNHASFFSDPMPFGWYAVYTRHQHEKSAAQSLSQKGFEVLLPLYRSENRWSDRRQVVFPPLFPNYVFVQAGLQRRVDVLRSPGVCWFVGNSSGPAFIPADDIQIVRRLAECPTKIEPHPFLKCGSDVRVRRGPLAGLQGTLLRVKNRQRVVVSLELLKKSAAVEVDLDNLEPIMPSPASPSPAEIHNC